MQVTPEQYMNARASIDPRLADALGLYEPTTRREVADRLAQYVERRGFSTPNRMRSETVRFLMSLVPEIEDAIDKRRVNIETRAREAARSAFMGESWFGGIAGNFVAIAIIVEDLGLDEERLTRTPGGGVESRTLKRAVSDVLIKHGQKIAAGLLRSLASEGHIEPLDAQR